MKRTFTLILITLMALITPMAWAQQQFSGGSGTETDPYLISNVDDWNTLADNVGDGNPYDGLYFQMTADIDVGGKMVGKSNSKSFQGIFDGNGYTLTFNKKTNGSYIAPFKYAKNATFKHLHTTGKVQESNHGGSFAYYAGIAGRICGSCNFISCRSSVTLDMDYHTSGYDGSGNGYHGGFVGEIDDGAVIFINCLYDGAIDLRNQDRSAGFVGKIDYDDDLVTVNFINCLVAPTSVKLTDCSVCSTYVGSSDNNTSYSFHNCYYRHRIQLQQGIDAAGMTNAELIEALGNGWEEVDGKVVPKNMGYYTFTAGDGSSETPYQIASFTDWNNLAGNILMGANYSGKYFQLTQNIEVTETVSANGLPVNMLGVNKGLSFRGTFDGNGHTITINYTDNRTGGGNENYYCGPFRFVNGATIKNLHVAGTIRKTDKKHAGGFVGQAFGTNHIVNCRSSVDIQSSTNGDGSHGGFLGDLRDGTTSFKNCVFDGQLRGTNTKKWGGFVGWVADDCTANFTNCLFVPTLVNVKNDGNKTYARKDGTTNFTNCYYTQTLGGAQGKEACSINCDEHVTVAPDGTEEIGISGGITSYSLGSVVGITVYNPCIKYGDVIYSGSGNNVKLNLSQVGETPTGAQANSFIATPGSLSGTSNPYTLAVPNENVTIALTPADWTEHTGNETDPYLIYTTEQWNLLANRVNNQNQTYSGKFFKLMADITITETVSSGTPVTMVGISDNNSFQGTFDGNGHTITLDYNDTRDADFCAPFRYINGATIQYLHVAGTIYKNNGKNAGGLVGKAVGNNTIFNCRSSVDIQFNKDGDVSSGGFIGELRDGSSNTTTFNNCLFDGKLQGSDAEKWGGFVGWVANGCTANFNSCLFNPTTVSIKNNGNMTFARHDGTVNVNNCYYTTLLTDAQGATDAHLYLNEALLSVLGNAWETVVESNVEKVVPIMSVYPLSGDGTENSPFLITSTEDWNHLASNQFMGVSYNGKYFQLTDNINVTRMVGYDPDHAFQGTFDGDGNTITVSYGIATTPTNIQYCAPFKNTYRATIKNLCTAGTIYTSSTHAGGVVGRNGTESLTMTNVKSSVTIISTYNGNANHGGLVGYAINATFEGCVFDGSLLGVNSQGCGGLLGWKSNTENSNATFTDCLFAPTQVTVGTSGSFTIANGATNLVTINNCYYTQDLGTGQGTLAHSITPGDYVTIENAGTNLTEYEVSGLTLYTVGIKFNDTLYACNEDQVSLNLSCEIPEGFTFDGYNASNGGTISGGKNPYTLTMPNADVMVSAKNVGIRRFVKGYGTDDGGYVLIASPVGTVSPENVSNMLVNSFDLYAFDQAEAQEWRNYNANTFDLEPGKGYLYANSEDVTLVFPGEAYTGTGQVTLSKTGNGDFEGWNLVGNPFVETAYIADGRPFYTMNGDGSEIIAAEDNSIAPMEGVFVIAASDGETIEFTTTEPQSTDDKGLVLNLSQDRGVIDRAIVRFGEGGLLPKFQIRSNSTKLCIPQGGRDYAVASAERAGEMPVSFKAEKNGTYTLTISEGIVIASEAKQSNLTGYSYLHLIDNLTGADIDLLQTPSYTFESKVTDYASRFKLVFSAQNSDVENDDSFAFFTNGELVINGEGTIEVIDMLGRQLFSRQLTSDFRLLSSVFSPGIYVLRLTNGDDVKTQKIVIK